MKTFIEIGCADFETLIPLAVKGWRGFFVEPVARLRGSLINLAKEAGVDMSQVAFEPIAISDSNGSVQMVESVGEDWAKGISHVVGAGVSPGLLDIPGNAHMRGAVFTVPCETLSTFVAKRDIRSIDFLKIDVEGHELVVLAGYDWSVRPTAIKIEHIYSDLKALEGILESHGYMVFVEKADIYAIG